MNWSQLLVEATTRLLAAPPDKLVEAVRDALVAVDPAARCTLLLADYRLHELRRVPDEELALPIDGTDHGRCFAAQQVLTLSAPGTLVVPVTSRGDRLGVLEILLTGVTDGATDGVDEATAEGALRLGELLGQVLVSTDRICDTYRRVRRDRSLTLSAEMQWDLLPGRSLVTGYAGIAGQLEPAYSVVGDAYDWAVDQNGLTAVLVDGAGLGSRASSQAGLAVEALRNARREGLNLPDMARSADFALHAREGETQLTSVIMAGLDARTLRLDVVAAGTGGLLHVGRHGVRALDLDRDPPLGSEEDYPYPIRSSLDLEPGDRVLIVSDGVTDARIAGVSFGERLAATVHGYRLLGPAEVVRALVRELRAFHDGRPQEDDAVVLCLEVTGFRS